MTDFTIKSYKALLSILIDRAYVIQTFHEFLTSPAQKAAILRHDVDDRKENSLRFAEIQHERGIQGSYYFRVVPQSFDKEVIRKIAGMGHEVGYHYETMDSVSEKLKVKSEKFPSTPPSTPTSTPLSVTRLRGTLLRVTKGVNIIPEQRIDLAYEEFCRNLEMFREIVPVSTICMHGSPRSKFDNKDIWKKYDYRKLGIIGEPYFDIDFKQVAYLTDTGRKWNGEKVSIRDKVKSPFNFNFRTTNDIIRGIDQLPDKVMFTFHPQRWTGNPVLWAKELVLQNLKNAVKRGILIMKADD